MTTRGKVSKTVANLLTFAVRRSFTNTTMSLVCGLKASHVASDHQHSTAKPSTALTLAGHASNASIKCTLHLAGSLSDNLPLV